MRVDVVSEGAWNVASNASWAVPETFSSAWRRSFTVTVAPNNLSASRSGIMEVTTPEGLSACFLSPRPAIRMNNGRRTAFRPERRRIKWLRTHARRGRHFNLMKYATGLTCSSPAEALPGLRSGKRMAATADLYLNGPLIRRPLTWSILWSVPGSGNVDARSSHGNKGENGGGF
ncbi:MAG: hypothetical protein ACLUE0_01105 [Bacteroides uniformis]